MAAGSRQTENTASMEPGHEDREYKAGLYDEASEKKPQWSPVMKTGNTTTSTSSAGSRSPPQWSPVMKTGNTRGDCAEQSVKVNASMEPGHEDREYLQVAVAFNSYPPPQWSPVMKTGNTKGKPKWPDPSTSLNGARS